MNNEVVGFVKISDRDGNPIYLLIGNEIRQATVQAFANKLTQSTREIQPFSPFSIVYYIQDSNIRDFDAIIRSQVQQQMQRLARIIIVDEDINNPVKQYRQKVTASRNLNTYSQRIVFVEGLEQLNQYGLNSDQIGLLQSPVGIQQLSLPFYGREIQNYPIASSGIPVFLETFLNYFYDHEEFLKSEGVFRISGSYKLEQELVEKLKFQDYSSMNKYDPNVISTVLKNSLANLKQPIFPFEMYEELKSQPIEMPDKELCEMFQIFFAYMPSVNRLTVRKFAAFLKHVASFESTNLMGLSNLSIVFTPCFFRAENPNLIEDLTGSKIVVHHFLKLIRNVDYFLEMQRMMNVPGRRSIT